MDAMLLKKYALNSKLRAKTIKNYYAKLKKKSTWKASTKEQWSLKNTKV